jgi:hypothetical protein
MPRRRSGRAAPAGLGGALAGVRAALEHHAAGGEGPAPPWPAPAPDDGDPGARALAEVVEAFGLSPFERAVLLLCVAAERVPGVAELCERAQGGPPRPWPTFALALAALAALPGAEWGALSPAAPLRGWKLVEVGAGPALSGSPLRVDERILHHLAGVAHRDERLAGIVAPPPPPRGLSPAELREARRMALTWAGAAGRGGELPVARLAHDEPAALEMAAAACALLGLDAAVLAADALPAAPAEAEAVLRLWEREAALAPAGLLVDCGGAESEAWAAREPLVARLVDGASGPVAVLGRARLRLGRPAAAFELPRPDPAEQRALWRDALGERAAAAEPTVQALSAHFRMRPAAVRAVCAAAAGRLAAAAEEDTVPPTAGGRGEGETEAEGEGAEAARLGEALWESCRVQARGGLESLAQRIVTVAEWDDLVLPPAGHAVLAELAAQVRHRPTVHERWGFAARGERGLGITALFAGGSGTGKTLAAEVVARELRLDLYRVDLSALISKYVGETEKNLRRVFDGAEEGGAVLLFDEADAVFGKRSEVRDSHDRYANQEVGYLLQRVEAYPGVAVLTTNLKDALDTAFLRRIRFVVHFPFPGPAERERIWRRVFPAGAPLGELRWERLAQLNVAGGNIRNIALGAAFLAAAEARPVEMGHVLRAARAEYSKLERPLAQGEVEGWGEG